MLRFHSFAALCSLVFALTTTSLAQITNVDDTTSTPIPGAGHNYIGILSETVNPANGSVSLRINVPVPKARGITLPFSFSYDSNAYHLAGAVPNPGVAQWQSNTGYLSQGGWSFSVPMLSAGNYTDVYVQLPNNLNCNDYTNYMFSDPSSGQHALSLASQWYVSGGNTKTCPQSSLSVASGGDPVVGASLPNIHPDPANNPQATAAFPVTVFTPDGTVYTFPAPSSVPHFINSQYYVLPSTVEDRNGNVVNVTDSGGGKFSVQDTAGRNVISSNGFGGSSNTLSIGGFSYQVVWTTTTANFSAPPQKWVGIPTGPPNCQGVPGSNGSINVPVVSQIILPNLQSYQFQYGTNNSDPAFQNPYGLLNKIVYPDGGWVEYSYKWADKMNELADFPGATVQGTPVIDGCLYQYSSIAVYKRQVGFTSSSSPALTQTFTYGASWNPNGTNPNTTWTTKTTTVATTDNVRNETQSTAYTYSAIINPNLNNDPLHPTNFPPQIPVEQTIQYNDFGGVLLKTVNKWWNNQYQLAKEQTQWPNGQASITSQTTYSYTQFSLVTAENEWDYAASLSGPPTRMTTTTYQSLSGTPGYVADKACSVVICSGGSSCTSTSSNKLSETDNVYDGSTGAVCAAVSAGSATAQITGTLAPGTHDETNFSYSNPTPRGNVTKKIQWLKGGTSPTTSYAYDETGQIVSVTDPCGNQTCGDISGTNHTTTFSHADSYSSGTPTGQTNTYLTSITYPTTASGVTATKSFTYSYSDGQLTRSKDENGNPTFYKYNTKPTGCSYSDGLDRLTEIDYPDGGVTTNCYNDAGATVTTSKLITSGAYHTTQSLMDGLGRVVQTQLTSDPLGTDYVDTSYDGFGRILTISNPHRSASSSSDGTSRYTYDGLGRKIAVKQPDGSFISTAYSVGCAATPSEPSTTVTDEAGNLRSSCSDGLGRLVEVDEPGTGGKTGGFGIDTVTIGGLEQIIPAVAGSTSSVNVSGAGQCHNNGGSYYVPDSGTVSITVYGTPTSLATSSWNGSCNQQTGAFTGATASSIATDLANKLSSSTAGGVTATASNANIKITANASGSATNYGLNYTCTGSTGSCDFSASGPTGLTGGRDAIPDSGIVSLTVGSFPVSYSFGASDAAESIASALAGQFNDNANSPVTAQVNGNIISITANLDGSISNYGLTGSTTWNTQYFATPSFNISDSSSSLTGGSNGSLGTAPLVTLYSYDALSNLTCAVQKGTDTTAFTTCGAASLTWRPRSFAYDSLSRLTSAINPEGGTITYSYDANGNAKQKKSPLPNPQTSPSQVTTNYTYDVLNRLIQKGYAGMSGQTAIRFGYDGVSPTGCTPTSISGATNLVGLRSSMCDGVGSAAWSYDQMGHTVTERHKIKGITKQIGYLYWADEELASVIYPDSKQVTFSPFGNGLPGEVTDGDASFQSGFAYAPNGSVSGVSFGPNTNANAVNQVFDYNQRFQPAVMYAINSTGKFIASYCYDFHVPGGGMVGDLNVSCTFSGISHGNNGNLYQVVNNLDTNRTANYQYDLLNRIQTAYTNGPNWGEAYTIDAWGNLTNRDLVSGKTNYEPLAAPALTTNQLIGFTYDAAGNLINDGVGNAYTYDAENRLITSGGVTYSYDGDGNRVVKSNGTIYWRGLGDEVLAESDLSGTVSEEYVYVNGRRTIRMDRPSGPDHLYFSDFVGSTTVVTDINGNPQQQSDYYPFGGEIPISGSDSNHYKFNGKERDSESCAVGRCLDNFGARYYASSMGRFMTPDWATKPTAVPYANFGNPQSLDLYSYVQNNPTTRGDPDGHCGEDLCVVEGTAVVGYALYVAAIAAVAGTAAVLHTPEGQRSLSTFTVPAYHSVTEHYNAVRNFIRSKTHQPQSNPAPGTQGTKPVYIDPNKYPESARHAADAQAAGKPDKLIVDRPGRSDNRDDAMKGHPAQPGTDRDEYPPAVTREGGKGASVRNIDPSDNRGAGASLGNQIRDVPNGGQIQVIPQPPPPPPPKPEPGSN